MAALRLLERTLLDVQRATLEEQYGSLTTCCPRPNAAGVCSSLKKSFTGDTMDNYRGKAEFTAQCCNNSCFHGPAKSLINDTEGAITLSNFLGELRCPDCNQLQFFRLEVRCMACGALVALLNASTPEEYHHEVRRFITNDDLVEPVFLPAPIPGFVDVPWEAQSLCQRLWKESLSSQDLRAIAASLTAQGALRRRMLEKAATDRWPGSHPLRIVLVDFPKFQTLPAVLELWPQGYASQRHQHAGTAGALKVLSGKVTVHHFSNIDAQEPLSKVLLLEQGDMTWLDRRNFCCHQVSFVEADLEAQGFALLLQLHMGSTDEYEFDEAENRVERHQPVADFIWWRDLGGVGRNLWDNSAEGIPDFGKEVLSIRC